MSKQNLVVRTQSNFAGMYGLGVEVIPGVVYFKHGSYDLSKEELKKAQDLANKGSN